MREKNIENKIKYCTIDEVYAYIPFPSTPTTLDMYGAVISGNTSIKI